MEFRYVPPSYLPDRRLRFEWADGTIIKVDLSDDSVVLRANRAGLVSLAMHLLSLAQEGVPSGSHIHYESGESLEEDSLNFTIERADE